MKLYIIQLCIASAQQKTQPTIIIYLKMFLQQNIPTQKVYLILN
jgi:hypothetical protein